MAHTCISRAVHDHDQGSTRRRVEATASSVVLILKKLRFVVFPSSDS